MTPLEQLWAAVNVEGPVPGHHRQVMHRHRAEWPVLWEAIDRLLGSADEIEDLRRQIRDFEMAEEDRDHGRWD